MRYILIQLSFLLFLFNSLAAQERTVGLLSFDETLAFPGYNLFYAHGQPNVYLLNNCGEIVHKWNGEEDYVPGNTVYLTEEGILVRTSRYFNPTNDTIWAGGGGEFVQAVNWDSEVLWSFYLNDTLARLHHDIEVLPSGNVLMIAWEKKTIQESIDAGRDSSNINLGKLWPEFILEYNPILDSIVWEWHTWDHLVQDFDPTKDNYGIVANNIRKVNINYETNMGNADWQHMNSIDYNPDLDQILVSVPTFDEIWIIDHSTTTEEAASDTGGKSGHGGDLLFRWGNPLAYENGSIEDKKLFYQHDAHWISDFIDTEDILYHKIMVFNNQFDEKYSVVNIIEPVLTEDSTNYVEDSNLYLPDSYYSTLKHPIEEKLYSTGLSSSQYLPNGNFLIFSGRFGYAFELTPDNDIVWEYKVPLSGGQPVSQGTELAINANITFRFNRFPLDFKAFEGKDLSPIGLVQLDEELNICERVLNTINLNKSESFDIFPNPTEDVLTIDFNGNQNSNLYIFDLSGKLLLNKNILIGENHINVSNLDSGLYILQIGGSATRKLVKIN